MLTVFKIVGKCHNRFLVYEDFKKVKEVYEYKYKEGDELLDETGFACYTEKARIQSVCLEQKDLDKEQYIEEWNRLEKEEYIEIDLWRTFGRTDKIIQQYIKEKVVNNEVQTSLDQFIIW